MARLLDNLFSVFRKQPELENVPVQKLFQDVAWGERLVQISRNIPKYNPDDLVRRKRFQIYEEMMTDEQVKAVVRFKRDAITSRDFFFEFPEEVDLSDEEKEFRKNLFMYCTRCMHGSFLDSLNYVLTSMWQGFSMTEKVFDFVQYQKKSYVGIKKLDLKPADSFYFYADEYGNAVKVEQWLDGNVQEVDLKKFIHHVHNPEMDRHYGRSELREAYRAYWAKDMAITLLNIFLERHATGFIVARPTDDSALTPGTSEYSNLQKILKNMGAGTSIIAPYGVELDYQNPANTDQFERTISMHNLSIAKALLVPNLLGITEQGPHGSRALGEEHVETFLWTLDADSSRLEESLNEQLFSELAVINFADGIFPEFKFKPLSERKKMELIAKWNELVQSKAVRPNTADENHIREMLQFPIKELDKVDADETAEATDPQAALTGIQIKSLMEVIDNVAHKKIPRETGVQILVRSFPFNVEQAEQIMGEVGKSFEPPKPETVQNPRDSEPRRSDGRQLEDSEGNPREDDLNETGDTFPDETVIGTSRVNSYAVARAKRRVDFAVIDKREREAVDLNVDSLGKIVEKMISEMTGFIDEAPENNPLEIKKQIRPKPQNVTALKNSIKNAMRDGWGIGIKHGKDELSKTKKLKNARIDYARIEDVATEFFEQKSFNVAGKLTSDMVSIIRNSISQGIKGSKSAREIQEDIYTRLASQGFVTREEAQRVLGEAFEVENPVFRLNTVIRTNLNEAINEARYSLFTDPEVSDFVEALEYSAVLDNRVTEICEHLDGKTYPASDDVWNIYRPPNHMNCRSTLVAVTTEDVWTRDKNPTLQPNEGFS